MLHSKGKEKARRPATFWGAHWLSSGLIWRGNFNPGCLGRIMDSGTLITSGPAPRLICLIQSKSSRAFITPTLSLSGRHRITARKTTGNPSPNMPAPLDINKDAVRLLVIQYGPRETARMLDLPQPTVQAWSARYGWLKERDGKPLLPKLQPCATNSPADALVTSMKEDAHKGRAAALRLARRKLEHLERKDDDELLLPELVSAAHQTTKDAALAGSWANQAPTAKVSLTITGQHQIALDCESQVVECKWEDSTDSEPI